VFSAIGDMVEQVHLAVLDRGTTRTRQLFFPGEGTGAGMGTAATIRSPPPPTRPTSQHLGAAEKRREEWRWQPLPPPHRLMRGHNSEVTAGSRNEAGARSGGDHGQPADLVREHGGRVEEGSRRGRTRTRGGWGGRNGR
jgi:hypothetical protein